MDGAAARQVPAHLLHVQGLRGIMMIAIVIYHCDLPPTGAFVGIDAFFVISGYVITGLLLRELSSTGRLRFGAFYLRRIRRLLPVLALMLVTVGVLSVLLESPLTGQRTTARVGQYAAVSLGNLALYRTPTGYFDQRSADITLRHTWSLSVEEQIYLVFPIFLVIVLAGYRRRLRTLAWAIGAVALASYVILAVLAYAQHVPGVRQPQSAAYYLPFTRVWEFAIGVLLAVWHVSRPPLRPRVAAWTGGVGAAVLVGTFVLFSSETESSNPALIVPVLASLLVLAACRTAGLLARVLSWSVLVWIGDRSYGWYLWHWPFIVFARDLWPDRTLPLLGAAVVGLLVSMVTYRHVEERFRRPRRNVPQRQQIRTGVLLAAACFLVPVVVMTGLGVAARHDWHSSAVRAMARQLNPRPLGEGRLGCPLAPDGSLRSVQRCSAGTGTGRPVYLVGDSNAGQFADGLEQVAFDTGRPLVLLWRPGCSYADVTVQRPDYDVAGCDRYNSAVADWLHANGGATVVVANGGEFLHAADVALRDRGSGRFADTDEDTGKAVIWQDGLTRSLDDLRAADHEVIVLGLLAHPGGVDDSGQDVWDPLACGLVKILTSSCGLTVSLADEDDRQADAIAVETAAARSAGAHYVSLRRDVCPGGTCHTFADGRWIYRNGTHITVRESRSLAPQLATALTAG